MFILVSPALILWRVWQSHGDLTQRLALTESLTESLPGSLSAGLTSNSAPLSLTVLPSFDLLDAAGQPPIWTMAAVAILSVYLGFVGAVLLGFYAGLLLNHRYQSRRDRALKQQVATLEKIWQQSLF
ncbi:MAG: hypothetical protein ACKO7W_12760 [Elainella sp.]